MKKTSLPHRDPEALDTVSVAKTSFCFKKAWYFSFFAIFSQSVFARLQASPSCSIPAASGTLIWEDTPIMTSESDWIPDRNFDFFLKFELFNEYDNDRMLTPRFF